LNPASGLDEYMVPLNMGPASATTQPEMPMKSGARAVGALQPVVDELAGRIVRRQEKDVRTAWAKDPQNIRTWLKRFEAEWIGVMHNQALPVMRAYGTMVEVESVDTWANERALKLAREWWSESAAKMEAGDPEAVLMEWQTAGAAQMAARLNQVMMGTEE
jgi:hypothetical protein